MTNLRYSDEPVHVGMLRYVGGDNGVAAHIITELLPPKQFWDVEHRQQATTYPYRVRPTTEAEETTYSAGVLVVFPPGKAVPGDRNAEMRQSRYAMLGSGAWHEQTESGWINLQTGQLVEDPDRVSRLDAQEIRAYGV